MVDVVASDVLLLLFLLLFFFEEEACAADILTRLRGRGPTSEVLGLGGG